MVMAIKEEVRNEIIKQIPVGRLAKPEEIAWTVAFLADDRSAFITGANIAINGGMYMG
jgi:acetoacetyl-CoA reductase